MSIDKNLQNKIEEEMIIILRNLDIIFKLKSENIDLNSIIKNNKNIIRHLKNENKKITGEIL